MSRPSDWWVLDLSSDPLPGDPLTIDGVARRWSSVAEDAARAGTQISSLLGDQAVMAWLGKAGDAFRSHSNKLPGQLAKCADSYAQAASALTWWSGQLSGHQSGADHALVLGRAAREDLTAARNALSSAQGNASSAAQTVTGNDAAARRAAADTTVPAPDPAQVRAAVNRAAASQQAVSSAQRQVGDAQARLDAAKQMAADAASVRDQDGHTTSNRLHDAADAGIHPDSFWHKLGDALGKAWHVLVEIAKVVVIIASIIAIVIGGPIAWVVFAAAVIILADTVAQYAQGKASLLDVGLAALGCIPGEGMLEDLSVAGKLAEDTTAVRTATEDASTAAHDLGDVESVRPPEGATPGTDIEPPTEGMTVYRVYGPAKDAEGMPLTRELPDGTTVPMGSRPYGEPWTPKDPRLSDDFRSEAGLPDENPGTRYIEGTLRNPDNVHTVRGALPLDGNAGGWPEYLISDAEGSIDVTGVGGVNEPWSTPPGGWTPPQK